MRALRKKQEGKTLSQKIVFAVLMLVMVPMLCLAVFLIFFVYSTRTGDIRAEAYDDISERFAEMQYEMNMVELMARTVWSDTTFLTDVGKFVTDSSIGEYDRYLFQEETLSILRLITSVSNVSIARIYLDDSSVREYPFYLYRLDRAADSLWYEDAYILESGGEWYLDSMSYSSYGVYSDYETENNMASYVLPVKINTDLTGIFELALSMDKVVDDLYDTIEGEDIFLIDSGERLIGVDKSSVFADITVQDLTDIMGCALDDYAGGASVCFGQYKNFVVILSLAHDDENGIFLMKISSVSEQYLLMEEMIAGILLIWLVAFLLLRRAIRVIIKHLLMDFEVFSECIQEVQNGNLNVQIPQLEQVEINAVAVEYNRMLGSVKEMMQINVQREAMAWESQIKSLEKQIDAHFLYNVLDSIRMMAEVRSVYSVSDALLALGKMFRYNLRIDTHCVSLQEEIQYLENYLELCNIRSDFYVKLCENIEDPLREVMVPKLILQPIAENSITHGLDETTEDTVIYLKACRKESRVTIEMTDMGKGMDEEMLARVRASILDGAKREAGGIGLHNIHERIRLMYGGKNGVEIYSQKGCYTKVVLTIEER